MRKLSKPLGMVKPDYDVVIVGSGYGGAISACRLAMAGYRVCVLEKGREVVPGEFPNSLFETLKEVQLHAEKWTSSKNEALLDFRISPDMTVMLANGLGGGSLMNAGASLRPDKSVFEDKAWPEAFRKQGKIFESFALAESVLTPSACPTASTHLKFKALKKNADKLNVESEALPLALNFSESENACGVKVEPCQKCGDCWTGCNANAKNSLDKNYLFLAHEYGAEIFTHARVRYVSKIAHKDKTRWKVKLERSGSKPGKSILPIEIAADRVILAAGALGSTEILLRSREKGLKLSHTLGKGFSGNGDYMGYGYGSNETVNAIGTGFPVKKEMDVPVGPSAIGMIRVQEPKSGHEFILQDGTMLSVIGSTITSLNFANLQFKDAFINLFKGPYNQRAQSNQTFYVVSQDGAGGKMVLDKDRLIVEWPDILKEPAYAHVHDVMEYVSGTLEGSKYCKNLLSDSFIRKQHPITVHPLGGCPMGNSSLDGVVNYRCEVFNPWGREDAVHSGLMVVDGSVIPMSLGINPLLTISAISEMAMRLLLEKTGKSDPVMTSNKRACAEPKELVEQT